MPRGIANVVKGGAGVPPEPDWSVFFKKPNDKKQAKRDWGVIIREMHENKTLTISCGDIIERLVVYRMQYRTALANVTRRGFFLKGSSGESKSNPYWKLANELESKIRAAESDLGLNPTKRGLAKSITPKGGSSGDEKGKTSKYL